jgi:hypothetical protein
MRFAGIYKSNKEAGMNKRYLIVAGMLAMLSAGQGGADVIDPNTHVVERCAVITNLADFPDIAVVGAYTETMASKVYKRYVVNQDSCLRKDGYKYCPFYLVWVSKQYLETTGLDKLPVEQLVPAISAKRTAGTGVSLMGLIAISGNLFSGYGPDSDPAVREILKYRLVYSEGTEGFSATLAEKLSYDKENTETRTTYQVVAVAENRMPTGAASPLELHPRIFSGCLVLSPEVNGLLTGRLFDCRGTTVTDFTRQVRRGATYVVPLSRFTPGIYLLRAQCNSSTITQRMNVIN